MHGVITHDLYGWMRSSYGDHALLKVLTVGTSTPIGFVCLTASSDDDFFAFMKGTSQVTNIPVSELLEKFGTYIASDLVKSHQNLLLPEWSALDLIENTERLMHTAVRTETRDATPPRLKAFRLNGRRVQIVYDSPRKLCYFARGLILGIGRHFNEPLTIEEPTCMHSGNPYCELIVRRD